MQGLDYQLIDEARQRITGANVHMVKTWIFCYETSESNAARRSTYEDLLRDFVRKNHQMTIMRNRLKRNGKKP